MSLNLANIRWAWVILGVAIAFVIAFGSSICVVTGYSGYLGLQARGTPDMGMINEFAANYAAAVSSIFIGIGTLLGGLLAGRKAKEDALQNGLMVGIITALLDLVFSISSGFTVWGIVSLVLAVGGGWLGGRLASR